MPPVIESVLGLLGILLRAIGFVVVGFALGRLIFDEFKSADWRLKAIFVLGLFGVLIGITAFSSPGSAGAFALGVGGAYFAAMMPMKSDSKTEAK